MSHRTALASAALLLLLPAARGDGGHTDAEVREAQMLQWLIKRFDRDADGYLSYPELATLGRTTDAPLAKSWYDQIAPGLDAKVEQGFNYEQMWRVYKELNNDPSAGIEPDYKTVRHRLPAKIETAESLANLLIAADKRAAGGQETARTTVVTFAAPEDGGPPLPGKAVEPLRGHELLGVVHGKQYDMLYPGTPDVAERIRTAYGLSADCSIALRRAGEEKWHELDTVAGKDEKQVLQWLWREGTPLAAVLDQQSAAQYRALEKPMLQVLIPVPESSTERKKKLPYFLKRMRKVAAEFPSVAFVVRDLDGAPNSLLSSLGLSKEGAKDGTQTGIVSADYKSFYRWPTGTTFAHDGLRAFVLSFTEGHLRPFSTKGGDEL